MNALISLSVLSLLALFAEILHFRKVILGLVIVGLLFSLGLNINDWNTGQHWFNNMVYVDNYALAFSSLIIVLSIFWFLHSYFYFENRMDTITDKYALVLFSVVGSICLCMYSHLVMLFLGIEILSIPLYILAGSRKTDLSSNEASMKYFLMGSFATGFLLFGIALIYGATGSFHLSTIASTYLQQSVPNIFYVGILLMMVGLCFKVSAVPFHFWTPDVYQGAPTIFTTFMATIVKTAAFAAFLRLFAYTFASQIDFWHTAISILAVLSIFVGNITAVYQTSVKRMLAYSGIAHAGYMMLALLALNASSLLLYAAAYSISTIGAFTILAFIAQQRGSDDINSFRGLIKTNPMLGILGIICFLSLAGIPPAAGFFAKYYIFVAALNNGYLYLVLLAIVGSLIGVYYYLKVIMSMVNQNEAPVDEVKTSISAKILLFILGLTVLLVGIFPNYLLALIS